MASTITMTTISQDEIADVFSDLTPIPQDDGPDPICAIDYSPQFVTAYDYMRAILNLGEKSERALRLTGLCLKLNPANYTVWHCRRQCLEEFASSNKMAEMIVHDLQFAADLGGKNPKNYQIWYHRRALLESTKSEMIDHVGSELDYIATVLDEDSKNYHAWSHRQWVVRTVNEAELWENELQFAHSLIQKDPRNNSAWNFRWFVCHEGGSIQTLSLETAKKEADYAIMGAGLDPYNESPWRYLIGILKEQCKKSDDKASLLDEFDEKVIGQREVVEKAGKDPDGCANLSSARIDILEYKADAASLEKAIKLASDLATKHDPIRKKYWNSRMEQMKKTLSRS